MMRDMGVIKREWRADSSNAEKRKGCIIREEEEETCWTC